MTKKRALEEAIITVVTTCKLPKISTSFKKLTGSTSSTITVSSSSMCWHSTFPSKSKNKSLVISPCSQIISDWLYSLIGTWSDNSIKLSAVKPFNKSQLDRYKSLAKGVITLLSCSPVSLIIGCAVSFKEGFNIKEESNNWWACCLPRSLSSLFKR